MAVKSKKAQPTKTSCSCEPTFAPALERKVNELRRFVELAECMVMYASPARKLVWFVATHQHLLRTLDKSLRAGAVEFSSPQALAGFATILDPMDGDTRTYKHAKCKDSFHPSCPAECQKMGEKSYKGTDRVRFKECEREMSLPETSICIETYSVICTKRYYSDPECKTEESSYSVRAWCCT